MTTGNVEREDPADMIGSYALGVVTAEEQRLTTAYVLTDPAARAEYESLRPVADLIGLAAEATVDAARSARMKSRFLASIAAPAPIPISRAQRERGDRIAGWAAGVGLAAAAAVVFALVSTIQNFGLRSDLASVQAQKTALQIQLARIERSRARDRDMIADLVAADTQRYPIPQGAVLTHGTHAYLTLHALPALPRGKVYEVWTVAKGSQTFSPSVLFSPNPAGDAVVAVPENAEKLATIAVSVEPEGGSRAPTSKATFVRQLG